MTDSNMSLAVALAAAAGLIQERTNKMKPFSLVTGLALMLALPAFGQASSQTLPVYTTLTASGTTTASVVFATSPLQQVRVVGAVVTSDLAGSKVLFSTGVTPLTITASNALGTTLTVGYTNGFTVGSLVILEAKGGTTNAQIVSFTGSTNITLNYNVPATVPGDQVYVMTAPAALPVGATTVSYQGDALFVGNKGRPVWVLVNGTSACTLNAVSARYE